MEGNPTLYKLLVNHRPLCTTIHSVSSELTGDVDFLYTENVKGPQVSAGFNDVSRERFRNR